MAAGGPGPALECVCVCSDPASMQRCRLPVRLQAVEVQQLLLRRHALKRQGTDGAGRAKMGWGLPLRQLTLHSDPFPSCLIPLGCDLFLLPSVSETEIFGASPFPRVWPELMRS